MADKNGYRGALDENGLPILEKFSDNGDGSWSPSQGSGSGSFRTASGSMTRPADTNVYAAGDAVTTATSAAQAMTVTGAARVAGSTGLIVGGSLVKSAASVTNASFRGWVYQTPPASIPNDNAAFAPAVLADYQKIVCSFTVDFSSAGIVGSDGVRAPITIERSNPAFDLSSGLDLLVILEARAAYTPASAEIFRLELDVLQD